MVGQALPLSYAGNRDLEELNTRETSGSRFLASAGQSSRMGQTLSMDGETDMMGGRGNLLAASRKVSFALGPSEQSEFLTEV